MNNIAWQKSSFSSGDPNTNCVEIAAGSSRLHVRESEDPAIVLHPDRAALHALVAHLKRTAPGTE